MSTSIQPSGGDVMSTAASVSTSWHSYPKVWNLGHNAIRDMLLDPVLVEEKVDGSQFSFGKFLDENGEPFLRCRSKGVQLNVLAPDNMFKNAVGTAQELFDQLQTGWTYRGEYLAKPKHNTLAYNRIPAKHIMIFDINPAEERYLDNDEKMDEAARLGLEKVPALYYGVVEDLTIFRALLDRGSALGGQKVEGVVIKNYGRFSIDGKAMIGKFVSEAFKEVHAGDWKERNPKCNDIIEILVNRYRTPARWSKAVQHMREDGILEQSPRDIGKLIPATGKDIRDECEAEIKEALFNWAWPNIQRGVIRGMPEWYKDELLKLQFETADK